MKYLKNIIIIVFFSFAYCKAECIGDVNSDYRVDQNDLINISNYLLGMNDSMDFLINYADIDFNNNLDIFDLFGIALEIEVSQGEWCELEPINLSSEWQEQEDSSYYDHQLLQSILNEDISALSDIRGIIIVHRGRVVGEKYYNGSYSNQQFNVWSVTKSFISALIGQTIELGYLDNQTLMLGEIFYENNYTNQVSVEHLLTMSSGWPENWYYTNTNNILNILLTTPLASNPGNYFFYNNAACHLNSYLINTLTDLNPKEFAMENLFSQLGIDNPNWGLDADGVNNGSYDLFLTLKEMVKLGQLYLQNGVSGEIPPNQIVSSLWIEESTSNQINTGWGDGYGYLWWLPGKGYAAIGLGGQLIIIIPEAQLVIGTHSYTFSSDNYFNNLSSILYTMVVPIFDLTDTNNRDQDIIINMNRIGTLINTNK